jgi:hypothetical protein
MIHRQLSVLSFHQKPQIPHSGKVCATPPPLPRIAAATQPFIILRFSLRMISAGPIED